MRFLQIFGIAFATGLSGAMMPGPMLALVIGQTAVKGFVAVLAIVLGHALLELATIVLLITGLRAVLLRPRVRGVIGLMGGGVLVWMGVDMVQEAAALRTLRGKSATVTRFSGPPTLTLPPTPSPKVS